MTYFDSSEISAKQRHELSVELLSGESGNVRVLGHLSLGWRDRHRNESCLPCSRQCHLWMRLFDFHCYWM